ncbi:long-chain fatty acid--CoA ligase [Caenimonas sedimenti]|uniref:Long-chain fatty acid--CoA ligase n=1 Tax=Caenimonas sedimenti TaxID=2596921 RepID=A0A562ZUS1_9BURK|nr:AMP-binding protein [Caenimonas sedimenti]TWO72065.1 long-chain fatty acid--CoA ligase [Caenimonas sedimenti]
MIALPALPSTLEVIEAHALRQPAAPALHEGSLHLDFAGLDRALRNCATELHRLGIRRGHRVAVGGPGFARQLIVVLACEALGAATASFLGEGDPDAPELFALVDWVVAGVPQAVPGSRFVLIDDAFLQPFFTQVPPASRIRTELALHELQRIARTSGSSGKSKFIAISRQAQEGWVAGTLDLSHFVPSSRLLVCGPLVMNAALARSSRCLRAGGLVMVGGGAELPTLAPTDVWGLPLHLERLLDEAPAGYRAPHPVSVTTVGGALRADLRVRIEQAFGALVVNRYGSNEAGSVCYEMDAQGVGWLSPAVEVRILDAEGAEVAPGGYGAIALRTPSMADGYLGQPEEVNQAFRGGWFHSADVGAVVGPRRLHLLGRQDDLINVAGIKLPASRVEEDLRRLALGECTVLAVNGSSASAAAVGVAVVLTPGVTQAEAVRRIAEVLQPVQPASVRVLFVSGLPRLPNGKPDRMALLRLFA